MTLLILSNKLCRRSDDLLILTEYMLALKERLKVYEQNL